LAHQVASAEPGVALLEHVAQNLVLVLAGRGIALEAVSRPLRIVADPPEPLARLVRIAALAESLCVADRLLMLDVEAHHGDREAVRDEPRHAPDGALLALEIEDVHVAFGRAVELENVRDAESRLKLAPEVGAKPVA